MVKDKELLKNKRLDSHYWLHCFVLDTRDQLDQYSEEVSMELAKIIREAEPLSYLVRAAEWLQSGTMTEEQFLELTKRIRNK